MCSDLFLTNKHVFILLEDMRWVAGVNAQEHTHHCGQMEIKKQG